MIAIAVSIFALLCVLGAVFEPQGRIVTLEPECHEHAWLWIDELEAELSQAEPAPVLVFAQPIYLDDPRLRRAA